MTTTVQRTLLAKLFTAALLTLAHCAAGAAEPACTSTAPCAATELISPSRWVLNDALWVNSPLRTGQKALDIGWKAEQKLNGLAYGKSYTLVFKGKNAGAAGSAKVSVRFLTGTNEVVRVYEALLDSVNWVDGKIDFIAPPYVGNALVTIISSNGRSLVDTVSLQERAAIGLTEPIVMTPSKFVPAGHTLVFNDEFSGTTLNRRKWFTRFIYAGGTQDRLNDEQQRYRDDANHRVAGGVLNLTARKVNNNADGINYSSGMIRSDATFRYGYFEARVRMPKGIGVAPAFWLNPDVSETGRLSWPPEIDIFEFVNNGVEDTPAMLHSGVVKRFGPPSRLLSSIPEWSEQYTFYRAPFDFTLTGHVIGMLWTPSQVELFVDGKSIYTREYVWQYEDGTPGPPAHLLLNLAIGGQWAGRHGIDESKLPFEFAVDYVRVYQPSQAR